MCPPNCETCKKYEKEKVDADHSANYAECHPDIGDTDLGAQYEEKTELV